MRIDVDKYLSWSFHLAERNCWHMLRAAWLDLTGQDLGDRTPELITKSALLGRFETDVPAFRLLDGPEDPSIVLMTRRGVVPHVGAFFGGRILQVTPAGASYLPPAQACVGFELVRYYR